MWKFIRVLKKVLFGNKIGEAFIIFLSKNRLTYKFSRKLIVPNNKYSLNSIRLTYRNDKRFKLDISNEVDHFLYFYHDSSFDYLNSEILASSVILDIGGNIGAFALYFEKVNPSAVIYTFEPHPVTYKRMINNLQMNKSTINSFNIGLGESKGQYKLYEVDKHNAGMNRIFEKDQSYPYSVIFIENLDDFWNDRSAIDFIKIDVEGFELNVLKGAKKLLLKYSPVLVIELDDNNLRNNGHTAKALIEFLENLGYNSITTTDLAKEKITTNQNFENCHFDILVKNIIY